MTVAAQRAMTAREWGLLALLSLLWGGSYFFVGVAVKEIPPLTLVTLRVGLAAALLWVARANSRRRPAQKREGRCGAGDPGLRQQCAALRADHMGPDASGERARLDPDRGDAALHRPCRACPDRGREAQRTQIVRNAGRNGGRRLAHRP